MSYEGHAANRSLKRSGKRREKEHRFYSPPSRKASEGNLRTYIVFSMFREMHGLPTEA